MNSLIGLVSSCLQHSNFAAVFLDAALKSFVILAVAGGLCLGWRRASAATRHLIWFLALTSLPCLLFLSATLPPWHQPLWSVSTGFNSGNQFSLALEFAPGAGAGFSHDHTPGPTAASELSRADGVRPGGTQHLATHFNTSWLVVTFLAWLCGVGLVLVSQVVAQLRLCRISRQARSPQNAEWLLLLQKLGAELRLGRTVTLLQSVDNVMPVTWGWWRPMILLPAEADEWSPERRRVVLLHELGHVKRWDCLTQLAARMVCAFYWFNPLVWLAARRMCVERERACDDLVLNGGCKASDYASHLVEIAETFRRIPQVAAIAMARSSQLGNRVAAIVDASRPRRAPSLFWSSVLCVAVFGFVAAIAAQKPEANAPSASGVAGKKPWFDARLRAFFAAKSKQAHELADQEKKTIAPEIWPFLNAGVKGDWNTVTNLYGKMRIRSYQFDGTTPPDEKLETMLWQTVNETFRAWENFAYMEEKYVLKFGDDIINSVPRGSIYFGGTDPGRFLITAMSKSHTDADPIFTLTQNALADGLYLQYLRAMYGGKIYTPTDEDSQKCFNEYLEDARHRLGENKLKPGEDVKIVDNRVQVAGQVAVMSINGLLVKVIFDKNPDREFYVEESFPLDWMYPYLEPHGLIMKINRQPPAELSEAVVRSDHDYWTKYLKPMIGDWLNYDTSVQEVTAFAKKVHLKQDLSGFKGDSLFIRNDYDRKMYSKLRSSIAGLYVWRMDQATNEIEKARMAREADFAFRQALALCPSSPEAVFRYATLLLKKNQIPDAILVAETAAQFPSIGPGADAVPQFRTLIENLKRYQKAK